MLRVPRRYQPRRGTRVVVVALRASERVPVHLHYSPGTPQAGDRANRANPIESRNRFARNNNHDWIPRGFGGRTFRSP